MDPAAAPDGSFKPTHTPQKCAGERHDDLEVTARHVVQLNLQMKVLGFENMRGSELLDRDL